MRHVILDDGRESVGIGLTQLVGGLASEVALVRVQRDEDDAGGLAGTWLGARVEHSACIVSGFAAAGIGRGASIALL